MENQIQEENFQQGYDNYIPNINQEGVQYNEEIGMEPGQYDPNNPDQMPPIYADKIESIKETSEHQVKYFEPIEISNDEDVNKYLQSGKLMEQIAPKIMALKKETQGENNGDPSVQTEVKFELTQNEAIYNNPEGNNEDEEKLPQDNNNKRNNNNKNQNYEIGPHGIRYSSVLPPKFAQTRIVSIDQYGNRHEEFEEGELDDQINQENQNQNQEEDDDVARQQYEQQQRELRLKEMELEKLRKIEEEKYKELQLKEKIRQEKIQQQRLQQEQNLQQKILQQKQEQQRMQQLKLQQKQQQAQNVINQNMNPYSRTYSGQNLNMPHYNFPPQRGPNNNLYTQSNLGNNFIHQEQQQNDPIVQKAIKISGTLRPKKNAMGMNNQLLLAVQKIQRKWRNHFLKMQFERIKPQLRAEAEEFLNKQYELCDKGGHAQSDDDFCLDGWKKFYPPNDPFFNYKKGFTLQYGIKIRHPNNPNKVSVYEGDINIKNEKHGFGKLTTTKSVFLGEWRNDAFTGWGRETRRSGKVFEGKYIDGLVNGKGFLKSSKGNTYIGDFLNSKRHGKGVLDTHTIHYEGDFKDDKLCGKGRIVFKNEGHYYEGQFDNNEINGFGTFKWKNGDSYTGQMKNGKMHGNGRYRYNNGHVFEGTYVDGVKCGKGKNYYDNNNAINNIQKNNNNINKNKDSNGSKVFNKSGMNSKVKKVE